MAIAADPERAFFLPRPEEPLPEGYARIYFGAEFCPWLLPTPEAAERACRAAHSDGRTFTLVTPVLIEPVLPRLRSLLVAAASWLQAGDELLISDWGALDPARSLLPNIPVILGRTLSGQKRGPRILDLELTAEQRAYFRQTRWHSRESAALLAELGIARVELDNLLQGLAPLPPGLRASVHHPYAMVTSGRHCPFREKMTDRDCPAPCGEVFTLSCDETVIPLLQGGNTQFLRHDSLPTDLAALAVDRLVCHPRLPR